MCCFPRTQCIDLRTLPSTPAVVVVCISWECGSFLKPSLPPSDLFQEVFLPEAGAARYEGHKMQDNACGGESQMESVSAFYSTIKIHLTMQIYIQYNPMQCM